MDDNFLKRISIYLDFAKKNPGLFSNNADSVRIVLDPTQIFEAESKSTKNNLQLGLPPTGAQVGIISQDPWVTVIRDALQFSDGAIRLHTRVMNRINHGVAVLPIFDQKIVLIRHFRHPLRKTILEIPRGAIDENDSLEETARHELIEEIGGEAGELIPLGFVYGSTNLFANGSYLYITHLKSLSGLPQLDEGVEAIEMLTIEEFETMMIQGKIEEAFTIAAFSQARLRGLV
jgi:ADP-ribose pyrophosphatase